MSNTLTPEQDLIVRQFYTQVVSDESLFPSQPASRRQAAGMCRNLLGYLLIDGKHVSADKVEGKGFTFGTSMDLEDEWEADTRRAEDEANNPKNRSKADSGKQTKNPPLWKALLSKDV